MKQFYKILVLTFLPVVMWSQNNTTIEVIYVKAYKNYKDNSNTEPQIMKNLEYQLFCNKHEARFEHIQNMANDGDKDNIRYIGRGGGMGIYYKNLIEKKNLHQLKSLDNNNYYIIIEKFNKYNWILLNDRKKILGYDCFKAKTSFTEYNPFKRKDVTLKYTVWYAPSLSRPFGPAGYDGLPGLVLESYTSSFYLIANKITFHDISRKIDSPKNGKLVTLKEFNNILYKTLLKFGGKE